MGLTKRVLSILLALMVLSIGMIAGATAASAAQGTTYTETVNVYTYSIGGTIAWAHTYDGSASPEDYATLTIVADDVDGPDGNGLDGEQDAVYINGYFLGYLNDMGYYTNWAYHPGPGNPDHPDAITTTTFDIPLSYLDSSIPTSVVVEAAWGVEIETSTLTVVAWPEVSIDIKPWSDPNSVNRNKKGVIAVGILGSADFDVTRLNDYTMSFEFCGATATAHDINDDLVFADHIVGVHDEPGEDGVLGTADDILDVTANNDLIPDLVVHFNVQDLTCLDSYDRNDLVECGLVITLDGIELTTNTDWIRIVK